VRERSADSRRRHGARVAAFLEHYSAAQGIALEVPAETVAAILLIASDGFAQSARIDTDTEALYATFLDLLIPGVMEEPGAHDGKRTDGLTRQAFVADDPSRGYRAVAVVRLCSLTSGTRL